MWFIVAIMCIVFIMLLHARRHEVTDFSALCDIWLLTYLKLLSETAEFYFTFISVNRQGIIVDCGFLLVSESKLPDMSPLKCVENKDNNKVIIILKGNVGLLVCLRSSRLDSVVVQLNK